MDVWRISKRKYKAAAFSGVGADAVGGRWNPKGYRVVYASENAAVAAMETFVHVDPSLLPPMVLIHAELDVPDVEFFAYEDLPKNWRANPAPASLKALGKDWLDRCETAALMVPSVVVAASYNILLNPVHPDLQRLSVVSVEPFQFDKRMFSDS